MLSPEQETMTIKQRQRINFAAPQTPFLICTQGDELLSSRANAVANPQS